MSSGSTNPWPRRGALAVVALGVASLCLILLDVEVPDQFAPALILVPLLAITVAGFCVRSRILKVLCFVPAGWVIVELISQGL